MTTFHDSSPTAPPADSAAPPSAADIDTRQHIPSYTVFAGPRRLTAGSYADVQAVLRQQGDSADATPLLVFDDRTGKQTEIDLRDTAIDTPAVPAPAPADAPSRGPGRPRLGVVAREITLLPRHWEWLGHQPGGASVALRRLIDDARRIDSGADNPGGSQGARQARQARESREAAYAFMSAMAGNYAQFEEASRALFAGDRQAFASRIAAWPADVQHYLMQLATPGLADQVVPGAAR